MGTLVHRIKSSHRRRIGFLNDSKRNTQAILGSARELMASHRKSLKEMASDLRDFLSHSEASRKSDYKKMMEHIHSDIQKIQSRVKEVQGDAREVQKNAREFVDKLDKEMKELAKDVKDFLSNSESARKADFRRLMEHIAGRIDHIRKEVASIERSARDTLGNYKAERKEAAAAWASLPADGKYTPFKKKKKMKKTKK